MEHFAALIDALVYTRSRNEKLRLIGEYLRATPDPDRGWALAALSDGLDFPAVKSSTIRTILKDRVDPVLWTLSRDFVGDTAETASLLWPQESTAPEDAPSPPSVSETVALLQAMTRKSALTELPALLDRLDVSGRYALLKLATGGSTQLRGVRDATEGDWLAPFFSGDAFGGLFAWLAEKGIVETFKNGNPKVPGLPIEIIWFVIIALLATWVLLRTPAGNWIFAAGGDSNAATNSGVPNKMTFSFMAW